MTVSNWQRVVACETKCGAPVLSLALSVSSYLILSLVISKCCNALGNINAVCFDKSFMFTFKSLDCN
jgi:hypothetical protein